jgi:hypothetical protein
LEERGNGERRERRHEPAQRQEDRRRPGVEPVFADPAAHHEHRPRAEEQAQESENLRDGSAQESADGKRNQQDEDHPIQPGHAVPVIQCA